MDRLTKKFTNGEAYCEEIEDVGIKGLNAPTYVGKAVNKLADYEDAEEKGLLPKFYLGYEFWIEWLGEILKAKIVMLQQKKDGTWKYRFCDERSHTMDYEENELGKYFFATKEEAEQVLKQMGE